MSKVTLYTRDHSSRKYRLANHRTIYPAGTIFVLRYAGRWETLKNCNNFTEASVAALARESTLIQRGLPEPPPNRPQSQGKGISVNQEVNTYLDSVKKLAPKTYAAYKLTLDLFQKSCSKLLVSQITKQDLQAFDSFLLERGDEDRTRANRVQHVVTFLRNREGRRAGPPVENVSIRVKFVEAPPEPYTEQELRDLFARSSEDDKFLWRFFLGTGFREAEVAVAEYSDINVEKRTIQVIEKPQYGFRPKDCEKRLVPCPDSLIAELQAHKNRCSLIFHRNGKPDGHLLRRLKKYNPNWILHRFRKSFATDRHEHGASARQIQKWLGHSSLETTLRYLAAADDFSEKVRNICNQTHEKVFAAGITG